jgi:hypothetical protein
MLNDFISLFPNQDYIGSEIIKDAYQQLNELSIQEDWFHVRQKDNKLIVVNDLLECSFHFKYDAERRNMDYFTVPWFPYKETKGNTTVAQIEISEKQMEFSRKLLKGISKLMKEWHNQEAMMVKDSKLLTPEEKMKYIKAVS